MDAIVYQAHGEVRTLAISDPIPEAGQIVVQVHASGICHTDIDVLYGRYGSSAFPVVPGHEYAGEIVALGEGVSRFAIGDRVAIDPNFECGECRACRRGLFNLCDRMGAYGVTKNGGFAQLSVVDQANAVAIGNLSYEVAALAEPVACVLNGLGAVGTDGMEHALIFGAGPIGLLMGMALKTRGVTDVTMVDMVDNRLELAQSLGFKVLAAGSADLATLTRAVDLVIDATGVAAVAESLITYCANGGRILFFGVCPPDATIAVSPHEVFRRQIRIAGAHSLNHTIPEALETIGKIGADIEKLISHRVPLKDIAMFLEKKGPRETLKVQAVL